ncbi:MAG: hypothetical protein ACI97A_001598 [Planctomycetota bacterium]|jgi:hypothetical protein
MAKSEKDPTEEIRLKASLYDDVDEGTSCTQSSFKNGKKAFLYIGMQGGRYKAMFKLDASLSEAKKLAEKEPDNYDAGSIGWVTARFTAEKPLPKKIWSKWLEESYTLSSTKKKSSKKKTAKKKIAKKKAQRKPQA